MAKGVTIFARMTGGKDIEKESEKIGKSVKGMGEEVDKSGKDAEKSSKGWDLFRKKTNEASKESEKHHHILGKLGGAIGNMAGMVGLGGIGYGAYDSIKTATNVQSLEATLKQALKNTGQYHAGVMGQISSATEQASMHGGFAQTEQLEAVTKLTTETGSYSQALQLNNQVTNLARGAHLGYSQAQKMVQMGVTGSVGRLQKYLGIIQPIKTYVEAMTAAEKKAYPQKLKEAEVADKMATARKIQGIIEQKYGGMTAQYNKTAAGTMSNLKNMVEALQIKVGKALLPLLVKLAHFFMEVVSAVTKHWPEISAAIKPVMHDIGSVFKTLVGWIGKSKIAMAALGVVVGLLTASFLVHKAIVLATAIADSVETAAKTVWTVVTGAGTVATWLFNAALLVASVTAGVFGTSLAVATGGLILIGVAIYMVITHWKQFSEALNTVWVWIRGHWPLLLAILAGPFGLAVYFIIKHWQKVESFFESVPGKLASAGKSMWDWIKEGFKAAIDFVIGLWNKLTGVFQIPGMHIHTPFGSIGWGGTGRLIPAIPMLAKGGNIMRGGSAIVGDRGPEILNLPVGAKVEPLTPAQRGNNGILGSWAGQQGSGDLHVHVEIDRREIGQAILREFNSLAARE